MIKVQVINKEGTIIAEAAGTREVNLPVSRTYEEGDRVVFLVDETPAFYVFQARFLMRFHLEKRRCAIHRRFSQVRVI